MNYEKSPNETEILNADERRVAEMCRILKKVEAPKDFDYHLKARLAARKARDFQPRFGFAFRYALPALGLILVLGLLAYTGGFLSSSNNSMVVRSTEAPPNLPLPENPAVSSYAPTPQAADASQNVLPVNQSVPLTPVIAAAPRSPKKTEAAGRVRNVSDEATSSEDKTFRTTEVLQPKGFEQNSQPSNSQNADKPNPISIKDVLSIMGISADFANGKWTVKSVAANSVGENSGVKANDVIEAIDEQSLSSETVFTKLVNGKSLTIRRKGEKSQINLRAKP
jgi:hypothetical protein